MILVPPAAPTTIWAFLPLGSNTMVGDMLERGRLKGPGKLRVLWIAPKALGTPASAVKSFISLLRRTPLLPATKPEPMWVFMVWVDATAFPSPSTIEMCVV